MQEDSPYPEGDKGSSEGLPRKRLDETTLMRKELWGEKKK